MFNHEKPSKLGTELSPAEQARVLREYVHRFTLDHKPSWASQKRSDGREYPVQFRSDAEWLAHTRFQVTEAGRLSRVSECYSVPTWPFGR